MRQNELDHKCCGRLLSIVYFTGVPLAAYRGRVKWLGGATTYPSRIAVTMPHITSSTGLWMKPEKRISELVSRFFPPVKI